MTLVVAHVDELHVNGYGTTDLVVVNNVVAAAAELALERSTARPYSRKFQGLFSGILVWPSCWKFDSDHFPELGACVPAPAQAHTNFLFAFSPN